MKKGSEKIVTRFPPSPTGSLHIGNIRTLLFNYLYTRKHGGEIIMRFEDTDKERSDESHEAVALNALKALGLDFDHGPYRQSERTGRYLEVLNELIEKDLAYAAEESEDEEGENVIRFRNPNKEVTFHDIIRGDITIDTTDFGDFVIARSKESPIYHLTVVVDDLDMNVTHVIRGEDHVTSTPRQILLIEALGGTVPTYAHLPLIIGSDKKKLGKRHGAVTYQEFRDLGYVPEAIINYLSFLGWNPGDDREIFSKEELIQEFSLSRVNNSPATFSYEKLDSINKHYLEKLDDDEYMTHVLAFMPENLKDEFRSRNVADFASLVLKERISKFSDVTSGIAEGEFDWFIKQPQYDPEQLIWKQSTKEAGKEHLEAVRNLLGEGSPDASITAESAKELIWPYAEENGKGDVLWPLRFALSGKEKSPDPFTLIQVLGREETLSRIDYALEKL